MNYVQLSLQEETLIFRRHSGEQKHIMATSAATDVVSDVDYQETFGVDPDGELEPEISSDFQVDPDDFTTSKHFKVILLI